MREWEPWVERIEQAARELGFSPRKVLCYEVDADTIYQQAAHHYPGMFSSWQSGRDYWRMKHSMENGGGYIYELIVETSPATAYLTNRNKLADHITVIAHCEGHAEVFEHSRLFQKTRRDIDAYFRAAGERFAEYEGRFGIDRLESLMDLGYSLMLHATDVAPKEEPRRPSMSAAPFADLAAIGKTQAERDRERAGEDEEYEIQRELARQDAPCPDLLWYLAHHAPIEDWQRDVLSVFRELGLSLQRRIRTKVLNEGTAMLLEDKILHALDLPQHMVLDQSRSTAHVTLPGPLRLNPYWLGWRLLHHIEERGIDVREVVKQETDLSLLRNYVDEEFVAKHRLYEWALEQRWNGASRVADAKVKTRKWEEVRDKLVAMHTNEQPEVVVRGVGRYGELMLDADGPLDVGDAREIIQAVANLWRGKVHLQFGREQDAVIITAEY